jgi:hypothetical protein
MTTETAPVTPALRSNRLARGFRAIAGPAPRHGVVGFVRFQIAVLLFYGWAALLIGVLLAPLFR